MQLIALRPRRSGGREIADAEYQKFQHRQPGMRVSFRPVAATKILGLWQNFGRHDDVDSETLGNTGDEILSKTRRIVAWSWLAQEFESPELLEYLQRPGGLPMITAFHDKWETTVHCCERTAREWLRLYTRKTRREAMYVIDRVIQMGHTTDQLASWLIQGGCKTFNLAGASRPL